MTPAPAEAKAAVTVAPDAPAEVGRRPAEPPLVQLKPVAPDLAAPVAAVEAATPAQLRRQADDFVQRFGQTSVPLDQFARWTQPVCVAVQGLVEGAAVQVKGRVEAMADELGVGTRKAGCKPNIQIVFTGQPQQLMDRVAARHERLLGYWHRRDRDQLKTVSHPIQAWYVTGTGGGGNVVGLTFARGATAVGAAGAQPRGFQIDDEDNGRALTGCGDSRFSSCLTSEFQSVLVVADAGKVQGLGLAAVADYVTMLALARPRSLDACDGLPSVIALFCPGGGGRAGLTRADAAYLAALYRIDLQARKAAQEKDIAERMAEALIKAGAPTRLAAREPTAGAARQ